MVLIRRFLLLLIYSVLMVGCTDTHKPTKHQKQVAMDQARLTPTEQALEKTATPGQYLNTRLKTLLDPKHTLVILDLDDTALTSPEKQWLGRSEMFYDMQAREASQANISKSTASDRVDPLLTAVYWRVPVILTDNSLPATIDAYKKAGATVIGMTARGHPLLDITRHQLKETRLAFSDFTQKTSLSIDKHHQLLITNGVVLTGHGVSKGQTLTALLESHTLSDTYKTIIMIDDKSSHLKTIGQSIQQFFDHPVNYTPVLCTYPQSVASYNSEEAHQQLISFLWDWQKDTTIRQLITQDAYTRKLLQQCSASTTLGKQVQCQALLNIH